MSDAKHTPGPWIVDESHIRTAINATNGTNVAMVIYNPFMISYEEHLANANLIAAAPELLEALEWMVAYIDEHHEFVPDADSSEAAWYRDARAAIAKAKGGVA